MQPSPASPRGSTGRVERGTTRTWLLDGSDGTLRKFGGRKQEAGVSMRAGPLSPRSTARIGNVEFRGSPRYSCQDKAGLSRRMDGGLKRCCGGPDDDALRFRKPKSLQFDPV
jgi:hypothetical protein